MRKRSVKILFMIAWMAAACQAPVNTGGCPPDRSKSDTRPGCSAIGPLECGSCRGDPRKIVCENEVCKATDGGLCKKDAQGNVNCRSGLVCVGETETVNGTCQVAMSMDCRSDGTCPIGTSCTDGVQCTSRYCDKAVCATQPSPEVCKRDGICPLGTSCTDSAQCASRKCDDGRKVCVVPIGTGTCAKNEDCASGGTCAADKTCRLSDGTVCDSNAQCLSNVCQTTCRGGAGDPCNVAATDCQAGLSCLNNKCTAVGPCPSNALDGGSACGGDQSGATCIALPPCERGRKIKLASDCKGGLNFFGVAPEAYCGTNDDTVYKVTTQGASCVKFRLVAKAGAGGTNEDRPVVKDQIEFALGIQNGWGIDGLNNPVADGVCQGVSWNKPNGYQPAFWQFSAGLRGFSLTPK